MKKLMYVALIALAVSSASAAEWLTDVPKALTEAKAENKAVLIDFTGSDWCVWCQKFKADVLDTADFQAYAATNLVLVEADYPKTKPQSDAQKTANAALMAKYKIQGFPTFVALDKNGKEIGRQEGYAEGGPKAFIAQLDGFKK